MKTLRDELAEATIDTLEAFDSLREAVTYHVSGALTYDETTGAAGRASVAKSVRALFYDVTLSEVNGGTVRLGDRRAILEGADATGITPALNDWIVGAGGEKLEVVGVESVPGGALFTLLLRRQGA